jgi:transposase
VSVAERVRVREVDDDEGRRLLRIIRRGTGSVVTWRRAQMVLLSAQGRPVAKIAEMTFTSADRVRDVIHDFDADGFEALYPKYKGGRPRTFTLPERREIKKMAKSRPAEHGLSFSTWSLAEPADFLVAEGVAVHHREGHGARQQRGQGARPPFLRHVGRRPRPAPSVPSGLFRRHRHTSQDSSRAPLSSGSRPLL